MVKISQLPQQPTATLTDKVPVVSNGVTDYETLQDLITLFFNNIPASAATATTLAQDTQFDFIKSGSGVWTADNAGVNRNASMSALTCYQNGQKLTVSAVTSRTFTASKDTYVDVLNTAGVATLVYTETTNNAASPALAANSIRLAIVVTGATTIATSASINQGDPTSILPIASSAAYSVTDSLGNLICPRDPNQKLIGYRQTTADEITASGSYGDVASLTVPFIAPSGRKVKASVISPVGYNTAGGAALFNIYDVTSSVQLTESLGQGFANVPVLIFTEAIKIPPASGARTYKAQFRTSGGGTYHSNSGLAYLKVELE